MALADRRPQRLYADRRPECLRAGMHGRGTLGPDHQELAVSAERSRCKCRPERLGRALGPREPRKNERPEGRIGDVLRGHCAHSRTRMGAARRDRR